MCPVLSAPWLHEEHVERALSGTVSASQIQVRDYSPGGKLNSETKAPMGPPCETSASHLSHVKHTRYGYNKNRNSRYRIGF